MKTILMFLLCGMALGQTTGGNAVAGRATLRNAGRGIPVVTATAKGPNQINLKWAAVPNPGYGYIVEIQSSADSRHSSFTELQPIPMPPVHRLRDQWRASG